MAEDGAAVKPAVGTPLTDESSKRKANAAWEELKSKNAALAAKADTILRASYGRASIPSNQPTPAPTKNKEIPEWMISLGMAPKKRSNDDAKPFQTTAPETSDADREDTRRAAAAALAALRPPVAASSSKTQAAGASTEAATSTPQGAKANDAEKRKAEMQASSKAGLDALLQQIGKKQKVNILDKSKQDWGEFKDEKGISEELEAYKKSGDKYLERVAFLQRADVREYERERDARLAYQSKQRKQGGVNYQDD